MGDLVRKRHANYLAWLKAKELNANRLHKLTGIPYSTLNSYEKKPEASLSGAHEAQIAASTRSTVEEIFGAPELPPEEREPNFVAEWRAFSELTVEDFAARLSVPVNIVLQLENGEISLSAKWARRIADAVGTKPGFIYHSPADVDANPIALASALPEQLKPQAARVLKALGTGTDG